MGNKKKETTTKCQKFEKKLILKQKCL